MPTRRTPREDRIVEIDVESIGFEGVSVGRLDGVVHFVKGALPGERVRARVLRSKKNLVEAEAVEILTASPSRVAPPCPHVGACGGCKWQHLEYAEQIRWKRQHVVDAFERLAKVPVGSVAPTMEAPHPYGYRNKMEFSFGASRWLTNEEIASGATFEIGFALGLHVPGRFDKVRHLDRCLLQPDVPNDLLAAVHRLRERIPVSAHHQRSHQGFLRHLLIRSSVTTGAVMAALITTSATSPDEELFVHEWMDLAQTLPSGSTVIHAVNDTRSPVAVGSIEQLVGPGYLTEVSLGVEYRISPFSFFQTNTEQLPHLVAKALEEARISATDTVWDLYCGTGTLALPAARTAARVFGAELVESSINDARNNAERNGISNVEFHVIDLHTPAAITLLKGAPAPDVIMIDPPRAGMHPTLVEHVIAVGAPRISYVSCNPATLARDCALLAERYEVEEVTPVDMFPQTFHVEAVARLRRRT